MVEEACISKNTTISNKHKEFIMNVAIDGICEWIIDENYVYMCEKWKKLLGYEDNEIENSVDGWKNLIHPDDVDRVLSQFYKHINNKIYKYEIEYRVKTKSGAYKWMLDRGEIITDETGVATRTIGILLDVTKRKTIEEALKNSEEKFRTLFNNVNDCIFLFEINKDNTLGNFIEVNSTAYKQLGYTRDELLNMSLKDIISKEDIKIAQEFSVQRQSIFEATYITNYDERILVEASSQLFMFEDRPVVLIISRDITERKKTEMDLHKTLAQNRKLLQEVINSQNLKTEMFTTISHEFKTPLNVMLGIIQLIYSYINKEIDCEYCNKTRDYMKIMKQNCYRLLRLINNFIDRTKIDTGYLDLNLTNCNIVKTIEEITMSVADYIQSKNITLLFDTNIEEKRMSCDEEKIERIMLNLLSNAVKHTKPEGFIWVNIYDKSDNIIISVKDNGCGIPKDKQKIIFERFRQAGFFLNRSYEGSGLGLSIVRSLVEMHSGTIKVESEQNKGTEFIVEIPVNLINDQNKNDDEDKLKEYDNVERINIEFSDIYSKD